MGANRTKSPAKFVSIVGVSRSGTSLLRNILNASREIAIADETNFLGHLIASEGVRRKMKRVGDLSNDDNVYKLVDFIYTREFRKVSLYKNAGHWEWLKENVDADALAHRILRTDRSDRAIFVAFLEAYAEAFEKPVIGEKTPAHFRYVDTLLDWFPDGKIVHLVRDPRAVFASEVRRRTRQRPSKRSPVFKVLRGNRFLLEAFLLGMVSVAWRQSVVTCKRYGRQFPDRYYTIRFEDLVNDPEHQVRQLCDFLGIDFGQPMLDQEVVSKGFSLGSSGFDAKADERWRHDINPWVNKWFVTAFNKHLADLGYAP